MSACHELMILVNRGTRSGQRLPAEYISRGTVIVLLVPGALSDTPDSFHPHQTPIIYYSPPSYPNITIYMQAQDTNSHHTDQIVKS